MDRAAWIKNKVRTGYNSMVRNIDVADITQNIKEMCIEANHFLAGDMAEAMEEAARTEKAPLGRQILCQLQEIGRASCRERV